MRTVFRPWVCESQKLSHTLSQADRHQAQLQREEEARVAEVSSLNEDFTRQNVSNRSFLLFIDPRCNSIREKGVAGVYHVHLPLTSLHSALSILSMNFTPISFINLTHSSQAMQISELQSREDEALRLRLEDQERTARVLEISAQQVSSGGALNNNSGVITCQR